MDVILLFIGLILLYFGRIDWVLAIIYLLASTYFRIGFRFDSGIGEFPFLHNVYDSGYLLLLVLFFRQIILRKVQLFGYLQNIVSLFFLFIILNGVYDYFLGTSLRDILAFIRSWIPLGLVYIAPSFTRLQVNNAFKYSLGFTLIACTILIIQNYLPDVNIIQDYVKQSYLGGQRGIKPPNTCMIFAVLVLFNFFEQRLWWRILCFFLLVTLIFVNAKMTHLGVTLLTSVFMFVLIYQRPVFKKFLLGLIVASSLLFLSTNDLIWNRGAEIVKGLEKVSEGEVTDNFNFRILLTYERLEYILEKPESMIRGLGFMSDSGLDGNLFKLGTLTYKEGEELHRGQLFSDDIAWSNFLIRFGFLGSLIFFVFYWRLIKGYKEMTQKGEFLSIFFFAYLFVCLTFESFGEAEIFLSYFYIFPILFLQTSKQDDGESDIDFVLEN